jgi:hypothetical protein
VTRPNSAPRLRTNSDWPTIISATPTTAAN